MNLYDKLDHLLDLEEKQVCLSGEDHPSDGVLVNELLSALRIPLCRRHRNEFLSKESQR